MKNKLNYLFTLLAVAFVLAAVGCKPKEDTTTTPTPPMPTNAPAAPAK